MGRGRETVSAQRATPRLSPTPRRRCSMRAERCLSARHEPRLVAAGIGAAGASARCDRVELLVHLPQKHELVQRLPRPPLVARLVSEVPARLLVVSARTEEVIWPVNALFFAPVFEDASWHLVQPAVRIHDQEHSRWRRLIGRHNIRRSAVQTHWRGCPRVCEPRDTSMALLARQRVFPARPFELRVFAFRPRRHLRHQGFLPIPPLILNRCVL